MNANKEKLLDINDEKENEMPENANKYLPSFILENPDQDEDDYFNNSDSDEESDEEPINNKQKNIQVQNNINDIINSKNFDRNNSYPNNIENSTKDNSSYKYLNLSQKNNYIYNTPSQLDQNKNFYIKNLSMINNNNYNINNLSNNTNKYFNNNMNSSNNQYSFNSFNNNINSSNNNFSFNSCNNNNKSMGNYISLPQSWNSFGGLSPINSFISPSFNNDDIKSQSFTKPKNKISNNSIGCKVIKYKHSKNIKFSLDDENLNIQSNLNIKKLLDMSEHSLYNYIITQKGSRDIQNIIVKMSDKEIELLIYKLRNCISDITIDKYGNYFIQKLIQICLPHQRIKLLEYVKNRFVEIAKHTYGTHCLQSLIEIANLPQERQLILTGILGNEKELALDTKGTHILQKFIISTKDEERLELNKNLINLIEELITDASGVCALNALVRNTNDKSIRLKIANYITNGGPLNFIQHAYANYAVQSLIKSSDLSHCDLIIETIIQNYLSLSMQKYSSNVVENCISYGSEVTVQKIFKSIIEDDKLESLLNNTYGNFVLEKLIERLNLEDRLILIKKFEKLGKNKSNISKNIMNLLYN